MLSSFTRSATAPHAATHARLESIEDSSRSRASRRSRSRSSTCLSTQAMGIRIGSTRIEAARSRSRSRGRGRSRRVGSARIEGPVSGGPYRGARIEAAPGRAYTSPDNRQPAASRPHVRSAGGESDGGGRVGGRRLYKVAQLSTPPGAWRGCWRRRGCPCRCPPA
jgi:hypothetical protein